MSLCVWAINHIALASVSLVDTTVAAFFLDAVLWHSRQGHDRKWVTRAAYHDAGATRMFPYSTFGTWQPGSSQA